MTPPIFANAEQFNQWFASLPFERAYIKQKVTCADGFEVSIQASSYHYCNPREDNAREYWTFELGFPTQAHDALTPYAEDAEEPTDTIYAFVPVEVVIQVLNDHATKQS